MSHRCCELISSSRGLPCLELWRANTWPTVEAGNSDIHLLYDVLRLSSYVDLASHVVRLPRRLNARLAWTSSRDGIGESEERQFNALDVWTRGSVRDASSWARPT